MSSKNGEIKAVQIPKNLAEMTDEEIRAWAGQAYDKMTKDVPKADEE